MTCKLTKSRSSNDIDRLIQVFTWAKRCSQRRPFLPAHRQPKQSMPTVFLTGGPDGRENGSGY